MLKGNQIKNFATVIVFALFSLVSYNVTAQTTSTNYCDGSLLTNANGYYGGFEINPAGSNLGPVSNPNPAGSELTLITSGNISADKAIIATNGNSIPGGISLPPHGGNYLLLLHPKTNDERLWFKTVGVNPGSIYNFCVWGAGSKPTPSLMTLDLYINGVMVGTGSINNAGTWTQVCGSYTVPEGVTSMEISIKDPTAGDGGPSHFVALDDICFTDITPSTNPDFNTTFVNLAVPGNVNTNDKVPTGTTYGTSPTLVSSPTGSVATLTMNSNGTYSFIANTIGLYTYNVPVCVPGQTTPCPVSRLVITVLNATIITNAPVANVDIATTNFNTAVTLQTLANDAAGNVNNSLVPSSVFVTSAPKNGTTSVSATTGNITYTPTAGFTGMDTLTYQVCDNQVPAKCATALEIITVKPSGSALNTTTAADDYKITTVNTPATGNVKTNDGDAEGNTQTVTAQTTPVAGKGTLVLAANGNYTFTPVNGFTGNVDFPYTTCDNGTPQACATATLHILVEPAPYITNPDFNSTFVNVAVTGNTATNDVVPTGTTYGTTPTPVSSPTGSVATLTMNSNGTYSFIANTIGLYTYNVPVCVPGQTAPCPVSRLVITVLNATITTNAPVANVDIATTNFNTAVTLQTLANDAAGNANNSLVPSSVVVTVAPLHGTTLIDPTTGNITYTPTAGFVGNDTLRYQVCDNQSPAKCATALEIITVKPSGSTLNTTTAVDDYKITTINTPAIGNVKTNDSDAEGNTQTVTAQTTTIAGKGTLVLISDGSYTFTPVTGFTGPVDFPYTTCDNGTPQACATATLHILVEPAASPDLTPRIIITPNNIIGSSVMEITVQVSELNNVITNGSLITLYVDKQNLFSNFTFNTISTTNLAGQPIQNSLFNIDAVSNPDFYVITTNAFIANSLLRLSFSVLVNPGSTKGITPLNVYLKNASGGETNFTNNSSFTVLTFSFL